MKLAAPPRRFVSRGGEKLAAALDRFAITVEAATALDAGASTGGFTDCLLKHGAAHVVSVDVAYGQFDWGLRNDERVTVKERTNIRKSSPEDLGAPFDLVTADLSFISLRSVRDVLASCAAPAASMILLVKPQFELPRGRVPRGGVVASREDWAESIVSVAASYASLDWGCAGVTASPLVGPKGNREFLLWLRADGELEPAAAAAAAVGEAP